MSPRYAATARLALAPAPLVGYVVTAKPAASGPRLQREKLDEICLIHHLDGLAGRS